jgi:hypothetical protein
MVMRRGPYAHWGAVVDARLNSYTRADGAVALDLVRECMRVVLAARTSDKVRPPQRDRHPSSFQAMRQHLQLMVGQGGDTHLPCRPPGGR